MARRARAGAEGPGWLPGLLEPGPPRGGVLGALPCHRGVLGSTQKCHMWGWGPSILNIDTRFQVRPGEGVWL